MNQGCLEIVAESGFSCQISRSDKNMHGIPVSGESGMTYWKTNKNQWSFLTFKLESWFVKDDSNASFHSWMGVPMVAGEKVFGLINLENRKPNFYTEEHAALAQTFANQAGIAIEKAQLYQAALRAAERRAVLHRISQDIVRFNQDPEQIYAAIHDAACKLMSCDVFMIILRDADKK